MIIKANIRHRELTNPTDWITARLISPLTGTKTLKADKQTDQGSDNLANRRKDSMQADVHDRQK